MLSGNQSQAAAVPQVTQSFNFAQALGNSPALMRGMADFLSPSAGTTGAAGTGLKLGGGDIGLSAPTTGFWSSTTSSTTLL